MVATMKKNLKKIEKSFDVFARRDSTEALFRVGRVKAPTEKLACVRAWYIYDEHRWIEMQIVPVGAMMIVRPSVHGVTLAEEAVG